MSDRSGIEWTDATWNPVTGCTKVSPGCDHCYAETFAERWRGTAGHYFERGFDVQLRPEKVTLPLSWRKPRRVFVNSMSDLFHDDVPDEYIARVFAVMAACPQHTFQILTKRQARMRSLLNRGRVGTAGFFDDVEEAMADYTNAEPAGWPLPNVWLGVSTEDQKWADIRIPALLDTPAAVRWISAEPLLGPIQVRRYLSGRLADWEAELLGASNDVTTAGGLDWVVVGGESGRGARPMHPSWARSLRDQCSAAGVPFLFKQWGEWAPESVLATRRGAGNAQYIELDGSTRPAAVGARGAAVTVQRNGKGATGRELDGRTHDEYPAVLS